MGLYRLVNAGKSLLRAHFVPVDVSLRTIEDVLPPVRAVTTEEIACWMGYCRTPHECSDIEIRIVAPSLRAAQRRGALENPARGVWQRVTPKLSQSPSTV